MPKKLQRKLPVPKSAVPAAVARASGSAGESRFSLGRSRVTPKALAEFTSQLAVLLDAGIPITKSLRILEGQLPPGPMKRIAASLVEDVEGGTALSEAMQKHDVVFDALYTNMVRAGEAGGVQDEILNRLASFMEKAEAIKSRVKGALAYPVAVLCVALLVLVMVFIFVIPKFKEQIARGGPVTVTHPEIIRYFMTIPEAVRLVLQAAAMGESGQVLVLDMGEPVRIADLARDMIRLAGHTDDEIEIVYTGLRPGEKLYEELLTDAETTLPTPIQSIHLARLGGDVDAVQGLIAWAEAAGAAPDAWVQERLAATVPE